MVPRGAVKGLCVLPVVLDSGSGMPVIGENCGARRRRGRIFKWSSSTIIVEVHVWYGRWVEHAAYLADVPAYGLISNTIGTVGIKLPVVVLPGGDELFVFGSRALSE